MKNPVLERLQHYDLRPRKELGQHFLIDLNVLERLERLIAPVPGAVIVEYGAGLGVLTERLLDAGARVVAVELDDALEMYKELVLPESQKQEGYAGMYVMRTPEGKGLIMSLWASEEAATAGVTSGYYDEQLAKFVTFYRVPPGREQYEVVFAEPSGAVST